MIIVQELLARSLSQTDIKVKCHGAPARGKQAFYIVGCQELWLVLEVQRPDVPRSPQPFPGWSQQVHNGPPAPSPLLLLSNRRAGGGAETVRGKMDWR